MSYNAAYLKHLADQYQPPTEKNVIDSVINLITINAHIEAKEGRYQYKVDNYIIKLMFQTQGVALGVIKMLVDILKFDVIIHTIDIDGRAEISAIMVEFKGDKSEGSVKGWKDTIFQSSSLLQIEQ